MDLVDRVKNILLTPKTEWPKIEAESATTQSIYTGYVMILAAIGPIAMVIHGSFMAAVVSYVIALVVTWVTMLIVDVLAPSFGGGKNLIQSLKLVAYAHTAAWIGGIFLLIPFFSRILSILATIYTIYTFYLGAPVLNKCSSDKAVAYTIVVIIVIIVLWGVIGGLLFSLVLGGGIGLMGLGMWR
jgi:hypothetical protein